MSARMNQVAYFDARARHYLALAREAHDVTLRETYESVARDFLSKAAHADANAIVYVVDGLECPTD